MLILLMLSRMVVHIVNLKENKKMKLSDATDDELRAECKKRGWAMVRPIKIEFDADYILDKDVCNDEN